MSNTPLHYEHNRAQLKNYAPEEIALKSGSDYDPERKEFTVWLMGEKLIVVYPTGEVLDENRSDVREFPVKTLVLRYLIHAEGPPPTGREINYRDVPGGQVYYRNFYGRCLMRLARTAGKNMDGFQAVMEKLNGVKTGYGDISYRFRFLNNIYLTFVVWRGDDEFPPESNILFDANTPYYLDAEDLAVVGDIAIGMLQKMMSQVSK